MAAGSVKQNRKTGTWYGRFDAPRQPRERRRQVRVAAPTEKECWQRLRARMAEVERLGSSSRQLERITVSEYLDLWLETKRGKALRTYESYSSVARLHISPSLGHLRVRDIRRSDIERAVVQWTTGPRADHKPGMRGATAVRQIITYTHGVFELAKDDGVRPDNPVDSVRRPPPVKAKKSFVLADGALAILQAVAGTACHVPVFIAFVLGLRPGELLALRRMDIHFDAAMVETATSLECRGKHLARKVPKTPKSKREIPVAKLTLEILQRHVATQETRLSELGVSVSGETPLFDDGVGKIWHPDLFRKQFRRFVHRTGLPDFQWRATRHSFASIGVEASVHTRVIAEIMGHENDRITSSIYEQVNRQSLVEANRRVADRLSSGAPTS